jgi:glycosyltransferase involved in cell wall biosynthesis
MKVLFIGHYLVVEEYQKKLKELTKYKDIELTLIVPKAWTEGSRLVKLEKIKDKDYKIIPVNVLFRDHIGGYFPPLLFKYILNIKPDIIHIDEEPFSLCAFYATFIGKLIKAKIIFSTFENIKRNYKFPLGLINRYILNTADYAICMNKEAESILIQRGFKKEIAIIPQVGVDLALFKHIDASKIKEKYKLKNYFVIGYIGRFVKEKGILTLIEAVKNLDYTDFKLLLIGDGYLKKEIKKMDLASKILFIKPVPQSKLVEYLNCMDVLVLPSETTRLGRSNSVEY